MTIRLIILSQIDSDIYQNGLDDGLSAEKLSQ